MTASGKCPSQQEDFDAKEAAYQAAVKRFSAVLLPILFLNGALGHFEKGNLSFAALELNFSAVDYGIGSGLYFVGYGAFILPSTFATIKYGARPCLGAMTFACGVVGMLHALISSRTSFFVLRCVLGVMEAGSATSCGHLLAQFYPADKLAQPYTITMLSYFAAGLMASPLATGLMSMGGIAGLHGWQWLFILEAVPSLLTGLAIWTWLPSHPVTAKCLTPEQRELVHLRVHGSVEEAEAARQPPRWSQLLKLVWEAARNPIQWYLTCAGLLQGIAFLSFLPWTTLLIDALLQGHALHGAGTNATTTTTTTPAPHNTSHTGTTSGTSNTQPGGLPVAAILLSGVPAITGAVAAALCAWHSDKRGEKLLHIAVPWMAGGLVLAVFGPAVSASVILGFVTFVLASTLATCSLAVMGSLLIGYLNIKHAGIGLSLYTAVVYCCGGFAGPVFVGALVQHTGSFATAMAINGSVMVAAALMMLALAAWQYGWLACMRQTSSHGQHLGSSQCDQQAHLPSVRAKSAPGSVCAESESSATWQSMRVLSYSGCPV